MVMHGTGIWLIKNCSRNPKGSQIKATWSSLDAGKSVVKQKLTVLVVV